MTRSTAWQALCALGVLAFVWGCSGPAAQLEHPRNAASASSLPAADQAAAPADDAARAAWRRTLSDEARAACLAAGGFVQAAGMMGSEGCYRRFADAGKACSDGSECLGGKCYYEGKQGDRPSGLRGQCAKDDIPFGCRQSLTGGRVSAALCVD